jgi:hypothetical protein
VWGVLFGAYMCTNLVKGSPDHVSDSVHSESVERNGREGCNDDVCTDSNVDSGSG